MSASRIFSILTLSLSALTAGYIGVSILFTPIAFHALAGIHLGQEAALLIEMRAASGPILAICLAGLLGVFQERFERASLITVAMGYGAYGLARSSAFLMDGVANTDHVMIAGLEIAFAMLCVLALLCSNRRYRKEQSW